MEQTKTQTAEFAAWLKTRPLSVQRLAEKYPPGWYRMKDGAPYGVSCAGTLVSLYSYTETGDVGVVVLAKHKRAEALEHERQLAARYGRPPIHHYDVLVQIDPAWMEPAEYDKTEELH